MKKKVVALVQFEMADGESAQLVNPTLCIHKGELVVQGVGISAGKVLKQSVKALPENWDDMKRLYPQEREAMDEATELEFVEDCFRLYEKEGFAEKYCSTCSTFEDRHDSSFAVVGRAGTDDVDLNHLPMWRIRFQDEDTLLAYPDEVIKSEIRYVRRAEDEQ